jgi:hypothetical protein
MTTTFGSTARIVAISAAANRLGGKSITLTA